jgi:polyhydroxybutyrate depolymerase
MFKRLRILTIGFLLAACGNSQIPPTSTPIPPTAIATATPLIPTLAPTLTSLPPTPEPTATPPVGLTNIFETPSGGVNRTLWLYQPSTYHKGTRVPLVLDLHGLTADAPGEQALSGLTPKAEAEGFIVVYPNGIDHAWRVGPASADVQFMRDLIAQLQVVYSIDPKRIYVTGMSNGGGMANRVGCDLADIVAAIGPVAGAYDFWDQCQPSRPIPVIAFHGLTDKTVLYQGGAQGTQEPPIHTWAEAWAKRNGCSPTPSVTQPVTSVTTEIWGNCSQNADVVLYTLDHHGHSWPGSTLLPAITSQAINATNLIWDFFKAHPLP